MATKFGRKNPRPECNALMGQSSFWGQPEVKLLRNAIWLLGVRRGQPEGNCLEMRRPSNLANAAEHYAAAGALVTTI